ncbi:ankyrin repeat-containing domain protein [Tuber brumale]|nr:ankyrin repeat-containing domain protein [Tuber brumale]
MLDVSIRLRRSILHNDLLQLTRLLKNHPKYLPNPDALANSSLHLAAQSGHLPIVQYLITYTSHEDSGISRNTNGDTPLMLAAEGGHEEVVSVLAEMFGRLDYRNKASATALILAARAGKDGVVRILLDGGSDIDAVDGLGNTGLHYASAYGHLKVIRTLLESGATFDKPNRQGFIPEDYSYTKQAEQYFKQLVQEREKRWMQESRSRAETPIFGRSERTTPQRQRASSGS